MDLRPAFPLALAAAALVCACVIVPTRLSPDAFGAQKTYAVVTIATNEEIAQGNKKFSEWLQGYNPARDSRFLLEEVKPLLLERFAHSGHFRLLPERQVLGSNAYRAVPAGNPKFMGVSFHVPEGYRFFADKAAFSALARDLGVDGVVFVKLDFDVLLRNTSAFGHAYLIVHAFDRDGRVVWKDAVYAQSDRAIGHRGGTVIYEELQPLLIDATGQAAAAVIAKLDEKLGAGMAGLDWDAERLR